jgi:hypothetical protein
MALTISEQVCIEMFKKHKIKKWTDLARNKKLKDEFDAEVAKRVKKARKLVPA